MTRPHARISVTDAPSGGEVRLIELDGHTIGLYRVGQRYYAVADRCPHRGAPLCSSGRVVRGITLEHGEPSRGESAGLLRCPWHRWDFDITTGRCLVHPRLRVRGYRVEHDGDDLIITLQHPTPPAATVTPTPSSPLLRTHSPAASAACANTELSAPSASQTKTVGNGPSLG